MGNGCSLLELIDLSDYDGVLQIITEKPHLIDQDLAADAKITPLSRAVWLNDIMMIELLLKNGADINKGGSFNITPLMWAAKRDNVLLIQKLLLANADESILSIDCFNALDYAILHGNYRSALILSHDDSNIHDHQIYRQYAEVHNYRYINYQVFIKQLLQETPYEQLPNVYSPLMQLEEEQETWRLVISRMLEQQESNQTPRHPHFKTTDGDLYETYLDGNIVIKEGWLNAKSKVFVKLCQSKIIEYDKPSGKCLRTISLREFSFEIELNDTTIILDFSIIGKKIEYKATDKDIAEQWYKMIRCIQLKYKHNDFPKIQTHEIDRYFGNDVITEDHFMKIFDTGDLLLFETNNTGAAIQRSMCRSKYDHVAIAMRVAEKYLFIFDANADTGVTFMEWSQFIHVNDLYEKMALRKLQKIDRPHIEKTLIKFLQEVHGQKYDLTFSKLFQAKSPELRQGYFCSELVAKAFKLAGLIHTDKGCGSFWPVQFTKQIQLEGEAELKEPIVVILKKHLQQS